MKTNLECQILSRSLIFHNLNFQCIHVLFRSYHSVLEVDTKKKKKKESTENLNHFCLQKSSEQREYSHNSYQTM